MWRFGATALLILSCQPALGNDLTSVMPPPGQPALDARTSDAGQTSWLVSPDRATSPAVAPAPAPCVVSPVQSSWYYRLDTFSWNEQVGGVDFVNANGPLSTVGYVRRSGVERFRIELFGGTMASDGGTQYEDQYGQWQDEPYEGLSFR